MCGSQAGRATIIEPLFPPTIFFFREADLSSVVLTEEEMPERLARAGGV